jgi:hypothetical protein
LAVAPWSRPCAAAPAGLPSKPAGIRALELLTSDPDGCTDALMLAHGFTVALMVQLMRACLATATPERVVGGGETVEIARVRITEAGRRVLEGKATQ